MDFYKAIRELLEEKKRLDRLIAELEALEKAGDGTNGTAPRSRRGRKSMSEEEKLQVSERMRRYWEARRAEKQKSVGSTS